ncbi:hypothetical protein [Leptospira sp. severe_002]|uniref:hypothetical protein n=1 Tax=Leptospira sp. severe_002 TaxID=2838237 RepID=UPI001E625842|nr:hypothetical protein [Leptospira sp. severe_002]
MNLELVGTLTKLDFRVGFRQNGAPSGLENRGLDARFAFTTKQEEKTRKVES